MSPNSPSRPAIAELESLVALRRLVDASPHRRIGLDELELCLRAARPDVPAGHARRDLLARLLAALADEHVIRMPRSAASWQPGRPPLPKLVTRTATHRAGASVSTSTLPWRSELSWAATARLTAAQVAALQDVQRWLRDRPRADPASGLRERSVDIFGDDKRLEQLQGGSLFAPGRLTLELLDCHAAPPPLVSLQLADGLPDRWLVIENASTFRTLAAHPAALGDVGLLVYGAGAQAAPGLLGLLSERPTPARVQYFGDVDRDGLAMAARATDAMADEGVDVTPHLGLYGLLADRGITAPSRARALDAQQAELLAAWLAAPHLVSFAVTVLVSGQRAMQEQVGPAQLAANASTGGIGHAGPGGGMVFRP